jgi:hypothetical protein
MRPALVAAAIGLALCGCGSARHTASTTPAPASTNPTGMTSSTPTGLAIPAQVTPIRAVTRGGRTTYAIQPLDRSTAVTYAWTCGSFTATGERASWPHPCGTVHVTVLSKAWRCTAATGRQPVCLKR